ncbi:MAG: hypothetical protein FD169_199 [Bacillota bacterium]|nr:MAG: hypothetical protein FD169_199 [Bacillota bacterium]MBS3951210.1 16S rRNA (uracil(1498)-N(3))-methyltransferase [Peptococcaceae bacterium]
MPRFLLSSLKDGWGELTGEEAHHVVKVHRYRVNDVIEVVGDAKLFRGVISRLQEGSVTVRIEATLPSSEPQLEVTLYQGIVKGDKLELIIQKAVELGVSRIVPVMCRRSVVTLDQKKARERTVRWQRIAQEASKQSGRAKVPLVDQPLPIVDALTQDQSQLRLMAYEGGGTSLKACFKGLSAIQTVSCLIGPEGGFEQVEVDMAKSHSYIIVGLGPRILRAETAPLTLLSILMYELGDTGDLSCRR